MQVKFTIDYDLIELVDAIGLDYDIVDSDKNVKDITFEEYAIEITVDEVEYHVENEEELHILNDEELCEFLLNPTLCEGLIYTQRIYDWLLIVIIHSPIIGLLV